jgi:hypothetical protein
VIHGAVVPLIANVLYASAADAGLMDNGREGTFYADDQMVYAEPDSICTVSLAGHPSGTAVYTEPLNPTSDDGDADTDNQAVYAQPHSRTEGVRSVARAAGVSGTAASKANNMYDTGVPLTRNAQGAPLVRSAQGEVQSAA